MIIRAVVGMELGVHVVMQQLLGLLGVGDSDVGPALELGEHG